MSSPALTQQTPEVLWTPSEEFVRSTNIFRFISWAADERHVLFDGFDDLWRWSVAEPSEFWDSLWDYFAVIGERGTGPALAGEMPHARWFAGARLNFAQNLLRHAAVLGDQQAVVGVSEDRQFSEMSWAELDRCVKALATALRQLGVRPGERVVAMLPNIPETVVSMLATASIGAVWSCCSPDFGADAIVDRFGQLRPRVLIAAGGYVYGGRTHDCQVRVDEVSARLPTLEHLIGVGGRTGTALRGAHDLDSLIAAHIDDTDGFEFEQLEFSSLLWAVFSSGTTGNPKALVHSHGGILLEALKGNAFHYNLRTDDLVFNAGSTSWSVWNALVMALSVGASILAYEGKPTAQGPRTLLDICAEHRVTRFGTGAAYLELCARAGLDFSPTDLRSLRYIYSTGSPLPAATWRWVYGHVKPDVLLGSDCGGTDVASGFVGTVPVRPVVAGESQGPYLGVDVQSWSEHGERLVGSVGEMVITKPMPSMPVRLWGDDDGSRYRESYFDRFPGVWRQGDWLTETSRGTFLVHGRSDSTINRGGIRLGSADIYRVVDQIEGLADSLVIGAELPEGGYYMPLFVQLVPGVVLDEELRAHINERLRVEGSPRHVPDEIVVVDAVPRTRTGKRMEVPVKRLLQGLSAEAAFDAGATEDPHVLDWFVAFAQEFQSHSDATTQRAQHDAAGQRKRSGER